MPHSQPTSPERIEELLAKGLADLEVFLLDLERVLVRETQRLERKSASGKMALPDFRILDLLLKKLLEFREDRRKEEYLVLHKRAKGYQPKEEEPPEPPSPTSQVSNAELLAKLREQQPKE